MSNLKILIFHLIIIGIAFSCVPHRKIVYLQKNGEIKSDTIIPMKDSYKIQSGDILSISITSFNPEATDFFNPKTDNKLGGYFVFPSGYIRFPILDSVYVKDLTIFQIQDSLTKFVGEHTSKPYIIVNLANFKFTVLGEFGTKGTVQSANNELTILEAIALAGDMSDLADKKHVKLLRKVGEKTLIITLDVTNRDIMQTQYFYIHPNDVIYAEPLKIKALRTNISQISTYVGLLSFALLIYNYIPK